ncbi:I78 family peptidase inhibitor [Maricaulis sp. CAU 1757]
MSMFQRSVILCAAGLMLAACSHADSVHQLPAGQAEHAPARPVETVPSAAAMPGDLEPITEAQDVGAAPVQPPVTGNCGMEDLQHFVGQPRVQVPATAFPGLYRVLGPDSVTTMEYLPHRVTIRVDDRDVVESIACG